MKTMAQMRELKEYRKELDQINLDLSKILQKRFNLLDEVVQFKKAQKLPAYDEKREQEMLILLNEQIPDGPAKENILASILHILDESLDYCESSYSTKK